MWDGWHLLGTVRLACLLVGLVFVPVLDPWALAVLWAWYYAVFETFYRRIWI